MGSRSSLHEHFVRVKTPMGLQPFEVRYSVSKKCTKIDLALKGVIRNRSKLGSDWLMVWVKGVPT